ncbi:MAG: ATP-dependent DNA helicase RecG [Oscillospiraceae bacterium]|nr:ATP-dependent DNA helicase RecG [Oscillospiraceae bacterium]
MSLTLQTSIQYLKGVGEKRAKLLQKLGIATLEDLLWAFPHRYEDWSHITGIQQAPLGEPCCIRAFVDHAPVEHQLRHGMTLYKTRITDGSGVLGLTIFNSGYLAAQLKPGEEYLFYGRVSENFLQREMASPQIAPVSEARLRPVYPLTEGITSRQLEILVKRALDEVLPQVKELLPEALRKQYGLLPLNKALLNIHRPESLDSAQNARQRLAFDELFLLQLGLLRLKLGGAAEASPALSPEPAMDFLRTLPFEPTRAQVRATEEAAADMAKPVPMRRLLQGDVGSGKTAVAAALLYSAVENGWQGALLAPTELLARQHHQTLQKLFEGRGAMPELLLGATPAARKKRIKAGLASGSLPLVVGTHALLQKDISFARLGLVVVDEQHRFGVRQRDAVSHDTAGSKLKPHMYAMSATPIPRSLAMVIYGDLDISVLDELPPGRLPVETYCVGPALRQRVLRYVAKHLDEGRQGYIVCPRVEEDEAGELAAATQFAEELKAGIFANYQVGLLHGKLKPKQKEQVMEAFAAGDLQLLVSTTVIEVGVDVPNAVIMVIENAERFGLSQLHQLRGRVGRAPGMGKSTCILISGADNEEALRRHALMKETNDGFRIAQEDLQMRGPGDFFGQRQHGLPPLRLANMLTDTQLLRLTREAALRLAEEDPRLELPEHRALQNAVTRMFL